VTVASTALPPKVDPESLALRARPRSVMRLNRRVLAAGTGALAVGVLGATLWSLQPSRRVRDPGSELINVERVNRAEKLDSLPKDYSKLPAPPKPAASVPVLGEPLPGDLGPAILKAQRAGELHAGGAYGPAQGERLAGVRDAEEAAKSGVFFRGSAGPKAVSAEAPHATVGDAPFGGNQAFNPMAPAAPLPADPTAVQNRQDQKEAFLTKAGAGVSRNPGSLQPPASPYQVMAGTVIPAALVTGINSDLPGQVIASVTESVYDTATGRYLLIPQGSKLIGRYDSQVAFGQRRVLLVWTRLILPDTSSIALGKLPGIDPAGYAGLEDGVDWHWDRILAGAALSTLLGVGAELAAPQSMSDANRVVIAARESAGHREPGRSGDHQAQSEHPADSNHPSGVPDAGDGEQGPGAASVPAAVLPTGEFAVSAAARKLRLGPLPRKETVKMTIAVSAELKATLDRYAELHAQAWGEPVAVATLVPHMLEAFMVRDRAFRKEAAARRGHLGTHSDPGGMDQRLSGDAEAA
jgi:type IV secretion system protein TrbI